MRDPHKTVLEFHIEIRKIEHRIQRPFLSKNFFPDFPFFPHEKQEKQEIFPKFGNLPKG